MPAQSAPIQPGLRASEPSAYYLHNGGSRLTVAGPVVINLATGFSLNGSAGVSGQSSLLMMNVAAGLVQLNSNTTVFGALRAPASTITLSSGARLEGTLLVDHLVLNGGTVKP